MADPAERFIAAATAPLGDNAELQVAGRRLLEGMVAGVGKADHAAVDRVVRQLSRNDATRLARRWRIVLNVIALAVFSGMLATAIRYVGSVKPLADAINSVGGLRLSSGGTHADQSEDPIGANLSPADRLLLLGDSSQESQSLRWKALWDSDPNRPAFFAHYAVAHIAEHKELPPDFLETAGRLDPGNSWFPLIAAGVLADQAADERKRSKEEKKAKVERTYEIKDKEKLREAIACLNQAAMLSGFESHQREILEARVLLLPKRTDSIDQLPAMVYMGGIASPNYTLIHLPGALYGECARISKEGDPEEMERLIFQWESIARRLAEVEDFTMIDGLAKRAALSVGYTMLANGSAELLPDHAKRLQAVVERFEENRAAIKSLES